MVGDLEVNKMADFNSEQISVIYNDKYEVLTPDGFKSFDGILCGINTIIHIVLKNGIELKCSPKHKIIINEQFEYVHADSLATDMTVYTKNGHISIISVEVINTPSTVYELLNVHDNHMYSVNDIYCHQCLYLDEFAFIQPHIADAFIASVFPTISSGKTTQVIITSTPNGMNHFHSMWEDAVEDTDLTAETANSYVRSEIPWNADGLGRDEEWANNERKRIGEIRFNQEYLCEFIGSVSTLIDHHFLKTITSTKPLNIPNLPEMYRIYELPRKQSELEAKNWEYVASLDSGYGVHQDSSVLQIFLVKSNITLRQVATISSNSMEIEEFCKKCYVILKKYHEPSLIIEQNGPGGVATAFFHSKVEYENLLHFDPSGHHMGLWASEKMKQQACILFKTYIQRKFMHLHDKQTINEMHSFGRVTAAKWGGLGGNHDDHITSAYWIPYYLNTPYYYGNIVEVNLKSFEEDDIILSTEAQRRTEQNNLSLLNDKTLQEKMLKESAEYLSPNDDEVDDGSYGLMFRR